MINLYDDLSLEKQAAIQRQCTWDLDRDICWDWGVDESRYFLPLDEQALAFPGLQPDQRRVLSQFLGLVINATIAEMEGAMDCMKGVGWESLLRRFPVNPEMRELGELFFEEEQKHAAAFRRYNQLFCERTGICPQSLDRLLPKAWGSRFLDAISFNARHGGFALWWVVAAVEEVSIQIYQMMHKHESKLDPLYFQVHRRHLEEEARHRSYAFLVLEMAQTAPSTLSQKALRKTDLILAQVMTAGWVMAELHRVFDAQHLKEEHAFFACLASCLPYLRKRPLWETVHRLFVTAPYVSFVLNLHHQKQTLRMADKFKVWRLPMPRPRLGSLFTEQEAV